MVNLDFIKENIENKKFEEAFEELSLILNKRPNNYQARYLRAMVCFNFLSEKINEGYNDFLILYNSHKKGIKNVAAAYLVLINYDYNHLVECLQYEQEAIIPDDYTMFYVYNAFADIYSQNSGKFYLNKALTYVEKAFALNLDINYDQDYVLKSKIYMKLDKLDLVDEIMNKLMINDNRATAYYISGLKNLFLSKNKDKSLLREALDDFDNASKIKFDIEIVLNKATCYLYLYEVDNFLTTLDSVKDQFKEENLLLDKCRLLLDIKDYHRVVDLCQNSEILHSSVYLLYYLGLAKKDMANSKDDYINARTYFEKSLKIHITCESLNEIMKIDTFLNELNHFNNLLEFLLKENPKNGTLHYCKALICRQHLHRIDDYLSYIFSSFRLNYLTYEELVYYSIDNVQNVNAFKGYLKNLQKRDFFSLDSYIQVRYINYLFLGKYGFPRDVNKALSLALEIYQLDFKIPCFLNLIGKIYQFGLNNNVNAFKFYQEAYSSFTKEFSPSCRCSPAYYAQALYNGIGVKQDKETAKKIILEEYNNFGLNINSNTAIFYVYLYLNGESGFDKAISISLLNQETIFPKFDVTRLMYLAILTKTSISTCQMKYWSVSEKEYYKKNKKEKVFPPLF